MRPEEEAASSPWSGPGKCACGRVRQRHLTGGPGAQPVGGPENRPADGLGWGTVARRWAVSCWAQAWRLFQSPAGLWVRRFPGGGT